MKNLLFTLFLICISFIESKGGIEKTILHNNVAQDTTEYIGKVVLSVTVMTSTLSELDIINKIIVESEHQERVLINGKEMVFFYNSARDTLVIREVNNFGADERYKMLVK